MKLGGIRRLLAVVSMGLALAAAPAHASSDGFEAAFDNALGTDVRAPRPYVATYATPLEQRIAMVADASQGRIGVAAFDLATGRSISVLGDQRFPMASTSKIAIAATFLDGVDKGRWRLEDSYPLLVPVASKPLSSRVAPVREGERLSAQTLIELMITRSSNTATDALLRAVGGPAAVNAWMSNAGIAEFRLDRDIATLVRDDGELDPALHIDARDSATPNAMVELIRGLHQGRWLSAESRRVILGAMERCVTGKRRIPALMPANVLVAHKTGSLNNTSSDVGIIHGPDGRAIVVAIYVTGQGSRPGREARIASIARAIYDGFTTAAPTARWTNARY